MHMTWSVYNDSLTNEAKMKHNDTLTIKAKAKEPFILANKLKAEHHPGSDAIFK